MGRPQSSDSGEECSHRQVNTVHFEQHSALLEAIKAKIADHSGDDKRRKAAELCDEF